MAFLLKNVYNHSITNMKNNYFIDEPLDGTDPEEEREFFYLYLKEQGLLS